MTSWPSAACCGVDPVSVLAAVLIVSPSVALPDQSVVRSTGPTSMSGSGVFPARDHARGAATGDASRFLTVSGAGSGLRRP